VTLKEAVAIITRQGRNLQRVTGYKCARHDKIHKYTFHSVVSIAGCAEMHGFDTVKQVVAFAKREK
jgi:hypothetical protein